MNDELYDDFNFAMCESINELKYGIITQQIINQIQISDKLFYNLNDIQDEPFKIVYRSKPIRGIVLELVTINQNYIP